MLLQVYIVRPYYLMCVAKVLAYHCHLAVTYTTEILDFKKIFNYSWLNYITFRCTA